jgi:tetratricopeptide (TPR) repeat protein
LISASRRALRRLGLAAVFVTQCVLTPAAAAQESADSAASAAAERLFIEAKQLMAEGSYDQACPKLAESHRIDPGEGTFLNLAVCHEAQGRYASAWAEFQQALSMAKTAGRRDREALAAEHIAGLAAKLAHLTVVVQGSTSVPDLRVTLDGKPLDRAAWGTSLAVDPGSHDVQLSAPGRHTHQASMFLSASDKIVVRLGPVDELAGPRPMPSIAKAVPVEQPAASKRNLVTASLLGIGLASVAVGSYEAFQSQRDAQAASAARNELDSPSACFGSEVSTVPCKRLYSLVDAQKRDATLSGIFYAGGGLMVAAAVALWFGWPRAQERQEVGVRITPAVGYGHAQLVATGNF